MCLAPGVHPHHAKHVRARRPARAAAALELLLQQTLAPDPWHAGGLANRR